MLHIDQDVPKQRGGHNAKTAVTRNRFLAAYEKTFGNVDQSCRYAGISRQTYYRWIKSESPVNLQFQRSVGQIRPREPLVDLAEPAAMKLAEEGNLNAAIHLLKARAKIEGGGDDLPSAEAETSSKNRKVIQVKDTFDIWLKENPTATTDEKRVWLLRLAGLADIQMTALSQFHGLF